MYQSTASITARAEENAAKQCCAMLGRTALNYLTSGAFGAAEAVGKVAKDSTKSVTE